MILLAADNTNMWSAIIFKIEFIARKQTGNDTIGKENKTKNQNPFYTFTYQISLTIFNFKNPLADFFRIFDKRFRVIYTSFDFITSKDNIIVSNTKFISVFPTKKKNNYFIIIFFISRSSQLYVYKQCVQNVQYIYLFYYKF